MGIHHPTSATLTLSSTASPPHLTLTTLCCRDAAHTVHPLAGQGLNLGIGDADVLADVLAAAVARGSDLGSVGSTLRAYEHSRAGQNLAVMAAQQGVKTAFGSPPGAMSGDSISAHWATARNLGLALLNASPNAKTAITRFAMGI